MGSYPYPQLQQQFSHLNSNRRHQRLLYLWRSLVICFFSSSLLATLIIFPRKITKPSQIIIKSNHSINTTKIYQQLDIPTAKSRKNQAQLPKFLDSMSPWEVSSRTIITRLDSISAIETTRVTKTIFPPTINIFLKERVPVTTAIASGKVGFLDNKGNWLEPNLYNYRTSNLPLTKIKVVNFQSQNKGTYKKLFKLISTYPKIGVKEIIWNESGNLILVTKDFKVRFGSNSKLVEQQFEYLVNFPSQSLDKAVKEASWLDLTNLESPFLQ